MKLLRPALLMFVCLIPSFAAHGQSPSVQPNNEAYFVGRIESVEPTTANEIDPFNATTVVRVRVDERTVEATYNDSPTTSDDDLHEGDSVVVVQTDALGGERQWIVTDRYRVPALLWLVALFFVTAILFAGLRGITSGLGLAFSLFVLLTFTVPKIAQGSDPFTIAALSAFAIAIVSLTVAHGFSKQTLLALGSTLITLLLSLGLSQWFVRASALFGLGTEEAFYLQFSGLGTINLRGLLLAGIVIGVLGVLDDVTTAQTAAVKELKSSAPHLAFKELLRRGLSIGREHIVSLVNTLALAYAGASLPLLLAFSVNEGKVPTWVILNGELIAEEVVRTLVGSTALVLAVPIATLVAAAWYRRA